MEINIENLVKAQIEEMDLREMVKDVITGMIAKVVRDEIFPQTKERIGKIINAEVEAYMTRPVQTNDGWGERKDYASFEDLFKGEFAKRMKDSWQIQKQVESWCNNRVNELFRSKQKEIGDKIVTEMDKLFPQTK